MAFCNEPARRGAGWLAILCSVSLLPAAVCALEFHDALHSDKLPAQLTADIAKDSKGSIAPTADGVFLTSESNRHAVLKFENDIPGADDRPLLASARIRTGANTDNSMLPAMVLYWDAKNFAFMRVSYEGHVHYGMVNNGDESVAYEYNCLHESKLADTKFYGREIFVRALLVSKNIAFFISNDGTNWRKLGEAGGRPGAPGAAPKILFGRGYPGEKPDLCNDLSKDARPITKACISEVHITDHAASTQPDAPEIVAKDTWEQTLAALEPAGIPRDWAFLAPAGEKAFSEPKDWIQVENWNSIKTAGGRQVAFMAWNKPDDEADDPLVDLRDRLEHVKGAVVLCRTDLDWPVTGEALLWYDSIEPCRIYVNNKLVFDYQGNEWWRERRPVKDRSAIPVWFEKGKNSVKIALRTTRGDASFYFRAERNDPARRIGLLQRMLELFPAPGGGWRATQAMFDLASTRENAFDFKGALASYNAASDALKSDSESLMRAFEGKLRLFAFLRDFDSGVKTADEYLAAHPHEEGAASALRAALRFETLAGHVKAARERARKLIAGGGPLGGAEGLRIVAGALAESGAFTEHLATLDEIAATKELKPDERARAAIESGSWRWEYERRRNRADPKDAIPEQERAFRSMLAAVDVLPGGRNPAVQQLVRDAEDELKNKHADRAYGTAWSAALMALLASDPNVAYYFALNQAHPIALPLKDKSNAEIKDQNQFKDAAWALLREKCNDPVWAGKWRIAGLRRSRDGKPNPDLNAPQTNADPGARYGDRGWSEIEPEADKTERGEFGFDVKRFSGDGQIVYLARDFDLAAAGDTTLHLSNAGSWSAWMDGKPVGHDLSGDVYKIEADRIPLHLEKGRHRVLIRLEPGQDGPTFFRARIGAEPQFAMLLYIQALAARQFPTTMGDRMGDLNAIREAMARRSSSHALMAYAQAIAEMFDDQKWFSLDEMTWAAQILHESNHDEQALRPLREGLNRLEDGPNYPGRAQKSIEVSRALARTLVQQGETAAADAVLRDAVNRYPLPAADAALCLAWRGTLRWELGMAEAALPFFERCARGGRLPDEARQLVGPGLEWARFTRPERVTFETSHETQALLDGVRRQLSGTPDDIEKAMRSLGEILRNTGNSLVKIAETPFTVRFIGQREYIRAMLDAMTPDQRDVYKKVVGEDAAQRLQRAGNSDPAELEKAALEFPYTAESQAALNRAGDLYFDRGRYGQAASIYQTLLRESNPPEITALACAKLALALALDGQKAEAESALKRLETEFAATNLKIKGEPVNGAAFAQQLKKRVEGLHAPAASGGTDFPFMGSLTRIGAIHGPAPEPGGVAWAQTAIASGALDNAKSVFGADSQTHLQSFPATDGTRVFIGAMESLRAFDLETGNILWTQTWAGALNSSNGTFSGFPSNCPLVTGGKIIVRAQSLTSALKCFDADTGALRWSSDAQPELKKLVWTSDPAAAYGMIFAMYVEPGDFDVHGAAALDAETGRLRWRSTLATGSTGVKVGAAYFQSTNHMGPPAIDAGELYVETGLASVAALNAFTGEARWVSSYPRMSLGDQHRGNTGAFDMTARTFKAFSRGPLSPMVLGNRIIASPHDGNGVLAFDRRDGSILWQRELIDGRYVAGIAGGNILACDDGVTALDAQTGAIAWRVDLEGHGLLGSPTLSGATLYMPMRAGLLRMNALDGTLAGTTPWDPRTGPVANLLIENRRIVGVSERAVVALGTGGAGASALPFYEARRLEAEGKLEEAAQRYAAAQAANPDEAPLALTARVRVLKRLDKRDEALAEIARFEREAPVKLSCMGGLWQTRRDAIVRSLRASLGISAPEPPVTGGGAKDLSGVLAYSMFLPGENPQVAHFLNDPNERIYARLNGDIKCLNLGENPETLWSAYVGTQVKTLASGETFLAAVSDREIAVLDRETGEILSQIVIANPEIPITAKAKPGAFRRRSAVQGEAFVQAFVMNGVIYAATESRLGAWDAASGRPLWERALNENRPIDAGLCGHDGVLTRVFQYKDDIVVASYDGATGMELQALPIERQQRLTLSPDRHYLVGRWANKMTCVDMYKMAILWRKDFEDFEVNYSTVEITPEKQIRYSGVDRKNAGRYLIRQIDLLTGNEAETIQTSKAPHQRGAEYAFARSFMSGPYFHGIFIRDYDNGIREQLVLRTQEWESGERLSEQVLPGTPLTAINPYTGGKYVTSVFIHSGGSLIYTMKEGVYVFRPEGETREQAARKLREISANPATPPERLIQTRRGLAGIEQPEALAFVTPADARVDGDLSEWAGTEPIVLASRADYVPLADGAAWGGAGQFSAKIYTGWNQDGVSIAVDVVDATPCLPRPGNETATGDRVRIVIDARADESSAIDPAECFIATLALAPNGSFFTQESGLVPETAPYPEGKAMPSISGKGRQYEFFIPWTALRRNSGERPADKEKRELRVGVAVYDGDANGTRGALEWGAGTTVPGFMPLWLGRLQLIDVSAEKVERYRKIIAMVPGSPEALKFMRLILLSKLGPNADAERTAELERFVAEHPDSANTAKALGMLRDIYRRIGEPDPAARLKKVMQDAKVPANVRNALDAAFKMWVYPDPDHPPKMIMVQFSNGDFTNVVARAYWGVPAVAWAKDGTNFMKKIGEVPKPGQWTELSVSPYDLDLEYMDIKFMGLTSVGGLTYFGRIGTEIGGKETVLIDGKMPDKWKTEYSEIKFVDKPTRTGTKSMTFGTAWQNNEGMYNTHFNMDWQLLMSFASLRAPSEVVTDPVKYQDQCRRAARIIDDTPEGFAFLRRAIELNKGDEKQLSAKAIAEIKDFMKQSSGSSNAYEALKLAFEYYTRAGDGDPMAKIADFIRDTRAPFAATRAFYSEHAKGWTEWQALGPFVALGERRGMELTMEPERAVDLSFKTQNNGRELAWKKISGKNKNNDPLIDLRAQLGAEKESYRGPYFAYAFTKFNSPTKRKALLAFGADDVISIWVNGKRVVNEVYTSAQRDKENVEVQLRSGENEILIKVGIQRDRLAFVFRLADLDGRPFDDIQNE